MTGRRQDRALATAAVGAALMAVTLGALVIAGLAAWGGGTCTHLPADFVCDDGFLLLVGAATLGFSTGLAAVLFLLARRVREKRVRYATGRRRAAP